MSFALQASEIKFSYEKCLHQSCKGFLEWINFASLALTVNLFSQIKNTGSQVGVESEKSD